MFAKLIPTFQPPSHHLQLLPGIRPLPSNEGCRPFLFAFLKVQQGGLDGGIGNSEETHSRGDLARCTTSEPLLSPATDDNAALGSNESVMLPLNISTPCHHPMQVRHVTAQCELAMSLPNASSPCHHPMQVPYVTAQHEFALSLPNASSPSNTNPVHRLCIRNRIY